MSSNNESLLAPESGQDSDRDESLEVRYSEDLDGVNVVIKDIYGLLVLKDELADWTRKGSTTLTPTCTQNPNMLDTYFKSILGGSAWGAKPKKKGEVLHVSGPLAQAQGRLSKGQQAQHGHQGP